MNTFLETSRLILRPWQEADAEALYKYAKDPAIGPIAGWPPHTSIAHSLEIIVLKETNEPVGSAGIMFGDGMHSAAMQADEAEIGYWIGVPYWGQGLIPEAVRCLLQRCFTDLGVSAVWCGYYDGNTQSRRVMEKCGLTYHHTESGNTSPLGDIRTEHFMRITAEEWKALQQIREINKDARPTELISQLAHHRYLDYSVCRQQACWLYVHPRPENRSSVPCSRIYRKRNRETAHPVGYQSIQSFLHRRKRAECTSYRHLPPPRFRSLPPQ